MSATMTITRTEGKLFVRDPLPMFFGLVFPSVLLLALGFFYPGFDEPAEILDGARFIDAYAPITLGLGLATLGLVTLPPILGGYRQLGILRRLRTTPVHPARLLLAQMIVHTVVAVVAALLAILASVVFFDVPVPENPALFAISFILGATSVFALGLLVGSRVRTTSAGAGIGMGIYFPMLFFAGVWIPRSVMPDGLRLVSDFTPLGSAVQAMNDSWFEGSVDVIHLLIMLAYAVVLGFIAARIFRWE